MDTLEARYQAEVRNSREYLPSLLYVDRLFSQR